jgi:hypothetical protein
MAHPQRFRTSTNRTVGINRHADRRVGQRVISHFGRAFFSFSIPVAVTRVSVR